MSNGPETSDRPRQQIEVREPAESAGDDGPDREVAVDEPTETISALMGSVTRRGRWEPPGHLRAIGALGSVNLDFREAELAYDVNDLTVYAFMGSVLITVPRDIEVEVDSSAVLGSVSHENRRRARMPGAVRRFLGVERPREQGPEPEGEPPLLRIRAVAFMGSVTIRVR